MGFFLESIVPLVRHWFALIELSKKEIRDDGISKILSLQIMMAQEHLDDFHRNENTERRKNHLPVIEQVFGLSKQALEPLPQELSSLPNWNQ